MIILEGKPVATGIKNEVSKRALQYKDKVGRKPGLAVVLVGEDPASQVYVGHKVKACQEVGFESFKHVLPKDVTQDQLSSLLQELNRDSKVDGILVQAPLPKHLNFLETLKSVSPQKDVDGLTAESIGLLSQGIARVQPCTPAGIIELLKFYKISLEGKRAVVVGRSDIVGKPMAQLLLQNQATVTICHSRTQDLKSFTSQADLVVAAIGKPHFFTKDYFKKEAIVVDVGIHRLETGRLCGDVDFKDVQSHVQAVTPVPGGVGPLTIAMLLKNTMTLAEELLEGR